MGGFTSKVNSQTQSDLGLLPDGLLPEEVRRDVRNGGGSSAESGGESGDEWSAPEPSDVGVMVPTVGPKLLGRSERMWKNAVREELKERATNPVRTANALLTASGRHDFIQEYEKRARASHLWPVERIDMSPAAFAERAYELTQEAAREIIEESRSSGGENGSGSSGQADSSGGSGKAPSTRMRPEPPAEVQTAGPGLGGSGVLWLAAGLVGAGVLITMAERGMKSGGTGGPPQKGSSSEGEEEGERERENPVAVFRAVEPDTLSQGR